MKKLMIKVGSIAVCVAMVLSNSVSFAATEETKQEKAISRSKALKEKPLDTEN